MCNNYKTLTVFTVLLAANSVFGQNKMLIPDTVSGQTINLELKSGNHNFYPSKSTKTLGANGNVLGPTLMIMSGDSVHVSVKNSLKDTTTIHWHGMHVPANVDGGPHTFILPKSVWSPSFKVMDKAATYWYHPHLHHKTNEHVSKGISGFIIVRDNEETLLNLPRTYGVDDVPIVIQTKCFDVNKQIVVNSNSDSVPMVNATINAFYNMPAQVVRLRLLNGSSQRVFNIGFSEVNQFYQIASDGGLLDQPVLKTRLMLSPGERAEILLDLTEFKGKTVVMTSFGSELSNGIYGASNPGMGPMLTLDGYNPNPLNGSDFSLLNIYVGSTTKNAVTSILKDLVVVKRINRDSVDITRRLTLNPESMGRNQLNGRFLINSKSFDMGYIDYDIPLNNVEVWSIQNMSGIAHPFHIHDVQFNLLSRNGSPPPLNEEGWKDVVLIKPQETVEFITKFEDFADTLTPYMFHCHMLTHEDEGMMGQFIVRSQKTAGISFVEDDLIIYPNPVRSGVYIELESGNIMEQTEIFDATGRLVHSELIKGLNKLFLAFNYSSGIYTIRVSSGNQIVQKKLIKL